MHTEACNWVGTSSDSLWSVMTLCRNTCRTVRCQNCQRQSHMHGCQVQECQMRVILVPYSFPHLPFILLLLIISFPSVQQSCDTLPRGAHIVPSREGMYGTMWASSRGLRQSSSHHCTRSPRFCHFYLKSMHLSTKMYLSRWRLKVCGWMGEQMKMWLSPAHAGYLEGLHMCGWCMCWQCVVWGVELIFVSRNTCRICVKLKRQIWVNP